MIFGQNQNESRVYSNTNGLLRFADRRY